MSDKPKLKKEPTPNDFFTPGETIAFNVHCEAERADMGNPTGQAYNLSQWLFNDAYWVVQEGHQDSILFSFFQALKLTKEQYEEAINYALGEWDK